MLVAESQLELAKGASLPVTVAFQLAAFGLGSKHDNDSNVLLPDDLPKVLQTSQHMGILHSQM